MEGAFTLRTPRDLFKKLESDYNALVNDRDNPYLAYNFFVTAEHMLDWLYPGYGNKKRRQSERESQVLLQVCSHLATGAKHFVAEAKHHGSVSGSVRRRPVNPLVGPLGGPLVYKSGVSGLYINLDGEAKKQLGPRIHVVVLAKQVLDYWRNHEGLANKVS